MKKRAGPNFPKIFAAVNLLSFLVEPCLLNGAPTTAAVSAFDSYSKAVEARLERQHRSPNAFLGPGVADRAGTDWASMDRRLRRGESIIERLTPSEGAESPGALLHHWRGTSFVPRAQAAGFEGMMRDLDSYPQHFTPRILQARRLTQSGNRMETWMRLRQRHIVTVVMDTTYEVTFRRLDARHGYSTSRSTRIQEIDSPGTSAEHALSPGDEHGFLWRLNTFWTYEERDDGLYLQVETVSLTRSIPCGFGLIIGPFLESIPRESLEFTLRSVRKALRNYFTGQSQ